MSSEYFYFTENQCLLSREMAMDQVAIQQPDDEVQEVPLKGEHDPKVTTFLRIARNGDKNRLIDLIKENCDIINASNHVRISESELRCPLRWCAGDEICTIYEFRSRINSVHQFANLFPTRHQHHPPQNGLNALHLATKENHRDLCLELIWRGININSATKKGAYLFMPSSFGLFSPPVHPSIHNYTYAYTGHMPLLLPLPQTRRVRVQSDTGPAGREQCVIGT